MHVSVLVNANGEIVGATLPSGDLNSTSARQQRSTDELVIPAGHNIHEIALPPELAEAVVDGRFAQVFQRYVVAHEGGKPVLKVTI